MKNFTYIPYNLEDNNLYSNIYKYTKKDSLVVVENNFVQKFYFSYVNSKSLIRNNTIISFEKFWDYIFLSDKKNIKDLKKYFLFYSILDEEIKEKFNINSYFDSIDLAKDFFDFFSYIEKKEELEIISLSKWQEERVETFFIIKEKIDAILKNNNYILDEWLDKPENLNLEYLRPFKKIVFYDIIDFPYNFKKVLDKLEKEFDIEFVFQLKKDDIDEETLHIKNISLPERDVKINLLSYLNDLDLQVQLSVAKSKTCFTPDINQKQQYKMFANSSKYLLNDTKFYSIIESILNISMNIKQQYRNSIDIVVLKENIFKIPMMEFFGLDNEDIKVFNSILKDEYRYISLELLEESRIKKYFLENINLKRKLDIIFKMINEIAEIKTISELNNFLCKYFFDTDENIKYFTEDKFDTIYDKIYEILGLLSSNGNMEFFQDFNMIFKDNLGKNIFSMFFDYLNKITIYSNEEKIDNKPVLKDIYTLKMLSIEKIEEIPTIVYVDNKTLPKITTSMDILTEIQKKKLGIVTKEYAMLIQKYRFFQNILNLPEMNIFCLKNDDENIDYSTFIYELIEKYGYKEIEKMSIDLYFKEVCKEKIKENFIKETVKYEAYKKEKEDFKNSKLYIGAYDYIELVENETFFFMSKLCNLKSSDEVEPENGISSRLLGNLLHKTLEEIFKSKWKDILKDNSNLIISEEDIANIIRKNIKNDELKIERFLTSYTYDILLNRLTKNIKTFLELLYNELKDSKIIRIEAEKKSYKEDRNFCNIDGIDIILTGIPDLVIETDRCRYIIDFKTGKGDEEQLKYYAIMLYGEKQSENEANITSEKKQNFILKPAIYNFWNESINEINFYFYEQLSGKLKIKKNKNEEVIEINREIIQSMTEDFKSKLTDFIRGEYYKLPSRDKLINNNSKFDFKKYYNYKNLIPLDKMEDSNE